MAYIGNFPVSVGFQGVNFKMDSLTKRTSAASGRVIRASNSTTLWRGTLSFPPMTTAEFRPIQAFVAQAEGGLNEFDIVIPTVSKSQSPNAGSVTATVDGAHTAGDETIAISTNAISANAFKAGDLVRFANHTKVYMVSSDINGDGSGDATLNIKPGLVEDLTNGEALTTDDIPIRMILSTDVQEFQIGIDNLHGYELNVEETI